MKLISLDLKNFKRIKSAEVKFPEGTLAIIGPNEAGKSTIIKGVLFALFGSSAFDSYDNVVNFKSNSSKVSLDFLMKEKNYRVYRVLKDYKSGITQKEAEIVEVLDDNKTRTLASGVTDVDNLVEKIIGFSMNELTASNIIAQKKLDKISKMTPKKWKELFNEFLNLKGFGKAIDELKDERREKKQSLENDEIRFEELNKQKDGYCDRFHELLKLSKKYLRDAWKFRDFKDLIETNSDYLRIVKEFIDKKQLKEKLEKEKTNNEEKLEEKKEELKRIEDLERENKRLSENLKEFKNLDDDDNRLLALKENFKDFGDTLNKIDEINERIDYLNKLEERLEIRKKEFREYKDTPAQLSYFREMKKLFDSLEIFYKKRDKLKKQLNEIIEAEEENEHLNAELEELVEILSYKVEYLKAKDLFQQFQAKINQIKVERNRKKDLINKIKQIRRSCPEDTPEKILEIEDFKKQKEGLLKDGLLKFLFLKPKEVISIIILTIIVGLIPSLLGFYFFIGIGIIIALIYLLYTFYKFKQIKTLIENLEDLLSHKKELRDLNKKLEGVLEILEEQYLTIKDILINLPNYYSKIFQGEETIEEQELSLDLYFKKIDDKVEKTELNKNRLTTAIQKNNEIIRDKPIVKENLNEIKSNITKVRNKIESLMEKFKKRYKKYGIDGIYRQKDINFTSVKNKLSEIEKMLQSDLDKYRSLKSEIEDLNKRLEEKPVKLKELEQKTSEKKKLIDDIINLVENLTKKYIELIKRNGMIKKQIQELITFKSSLEELTEKIHKDKNKRDKIEADIKANEKHIKRKPEVNKQLNTLKEEIDKIIDEISKITFPDIPAKIRSDFNEKEPQKCREQLENRLKELRERKNKLDGEMKSINTRRREIRDYLEENEFIIHDFFEKKESIKKLKEEIKIHNKSIELIEQVNRQIWDMQMPYITSYISKFLPKITMGRYRNLTIEQPESRRRKRYEFKIMEETKESFIDKKYLSGGTEDQVLLAIRVAVAMSLLPQSKGHYPKFLFLDEAFASSDSERRMEILNWLTKDLASIFSQIIIISHQKEIIEKIPFYYKLNQGNIAESVIPN